MRVPPWQEWRYGPFAMRQLARIDLLLQRGPPVCVWCGRSGRKLTIEHIIPTSHGGTWALDNLYWACRRCNHERGNKNARQFARKVSPPNAPIWQILEKMNL